MHTLYALAHIGMLFIYVKDETFH